MATKKKAVAEKDSAPGAKNVSAKDVMAIMGKLSKESGDKAISLEEKKGEDFCSTGLVSLDLILGGGYYGGQVFQAFGPAHGGKSSLAYTSAAWATQNDIPAGFMDHEGTTDKAYTIRLGMNYDNVMYFRPETGEWTYDFIDDLCNKLPDKHSGRPQAVILIDTVEAMKPRKWVEDPDNKQPAIAASMHARGWKRIQTLISNKHVAIVAANQIKSNVGNPYQAQEKVPGGNAWEFATVNLIRVSRQGTNVELPDGRVFQRVKFKTYKNKNFIPMQECEVYLELGAGWDIASDVLEFCKRAGYFYKRDKNGKRVISKGMPTIKGLSPECDGDYKSLPALEAIIRSQGREGAFFQACRAALVSGKAQSDYLSARKTTTEDDNVDLLSVTKKQKKSLGEDAADEDTEGRDEDDEDDETDDPEEEAPSSSTEPAQEAEPEDTSGPPVRLGKKTKKPLAPKKVVRKSSGKNVAA